jgi:hypothetical protein
MMFVMLVAAIGLVLTGLLAIAYGIGVQLSTGNTLIIAGVIGVCTGAIMLALWMTVRELKNIGRRLSAGVPEARGEAMGRPVLAGAATRDSAPAGGDFLAAEQPGGSGPFSPAAAPFAPAPLPPWQNEAVLRDHPIPEPMHPEPPPSTAKPKRNLLFSSTSRKERERAQARSSEPQPPDLSSPDLRSRSPIASLDDPEPPPASFEDAWPKADRARPGEMAPQRRSGRMPPTPAEANGGPAHAEDRPEVTVLKSGVVDGMAYSLYSDGSIEAQMPEGMMRFASIDELRAHLDQRL